MTGKVYLYLLRTYGARPGYWVAVAAVIVQTLLMRVVSALVIAHLASSVATGSLNAARTDILIYLAVAGGGLIFRLIRELVAVRVENAVYCNMLLVDYYKKLIGKDMGFYRDNQTGYLASTFRQHIDSAMELARLFRGELIQTFISLVVPTTILLVTSWRVGLAALGMSIVQVVYIFWSSSKTNKYRAESHEIYRKISGLVSDDVTNIVAYKTSGLTNAAVDNIKVLADQERETFWKRRKVLALLDGPRELITVLGTALAFWFVVSGAHSANQAVGLVVLTLTYMFQIFQNFASVPDLIVKHDDLVTKIYPTMEYLTDMYETIKDPKHPQKMAIKAGAIDFDNITFAYNDNPDSKVFSGFDLHIPAGQQVGVVGLSGAGKSTLASLLMRFDDITNGAIKIDGTDIRQVRQDDLHKNIAYVPQEPLLFHRTIKDNIAYFNPSAGEEQIIKAARAAHAYDFISKLPQSYNTLVGERGIKLSGGQKQRVVIARAILKNAPIMLFDEATSALDSESEKIIQKAMPQIIGKRTAIVIAHRLSTVARLDRIIVMSDGKIAEDGTHDELLRLKGRYYSLWQKQIAQEEAS